MAEGVLRHYGKHRFEVFSAGTCPSIVHPTAIQVMREIGIDISNHRSKHLEEYLGTEFDYIITVCDNAKESCPVFPGNAKKLHWSFPDPVLENFRRVRDMIHERFKKAANEL
jgi:arsenate reductase